MIETSFFLCSPDISELLKIYEALQNSESFKEIIEKHCRIEIYKYPYDPNWMAKFIYDDTIYVDKREVNLIDKLSSFVDGYKAALEFKKII